MTHDESGPQQDSAAQQVTVASPSDRAGFVHDFLYWGLKKFGTGRRDSFGHFVFVAARDFCRADPDLAEGIIEKAVSERRYAKPLRRLLQGTKWSERPREALRAVADLGYYSALKDAELESRISTQKNAHNFLRAYRNDLGNERGLTDRERSVFEAIVFSAIAALLVAGIAATSSDASAAVEASRRVASTAKAVTALCLLAGLAGFLVHVTCRSYRSTVDPENALFPSSEPDSREAIGRKVPSEAAPFEKCTSTRPFERRRCLVFEAGAADTRGDHTRAVKFYEAALATRYDDSDLTASDRASLPRLTIYAERATSDLWHFDTADILDRLASSHWRAGEGRAAVAVYQKLVNLCETRLGCETRQCTLLQLLKVAIGDGASATQNCSGAANFDYRRYYASGIVAEATNDDAWALIGFTRALSHLSASEEREESSAALARWTALYPESPRVPPDTYERFKRALVKMEESHRVVRQGRVFAFATASNAGVHLWVALDLPAYAAANCLHGGENVPSYRFDYIAGSTKYVNIVSMPLISTWIADAQQDVWFRAVVRFDTESGECVPFEDVVDVCVIGGAIRTRSDCPSQDGRSSTLGPQ